MTDFGLFPTLLGVANLSTEDLDGMTEQKTGVPVTEGGTPRPAGRPRLICHMMASLDGRIVTEGWPLSAKERREYEQVHATFEPDAWLCGRVTMEHFAAGLRYRAT